MEKRSPGPLILHPWGGGTQICGNGYLYSSFPLHPQATSNNCPSCLALSLSRSGFQSAVQSSQKGPVPPLGTMVSSLSLNTLRPILRLLLRVPETKNNHANKDRNASPDLCDRRKQQRALGSRVIDANNSGWTTGGLTSPQRAGYTLGLFLKSSLQDTVPWVL